RRVEGPAMIKVKRVYEPAAPGDGARFLVDRLWPRGVKRTALRLAAWIPAAAPSAALRRYSRELAGRPRAWERRLRAARRGTVPLLYGARDTRHNNAVALRDFLR